MKTLGVVALAIGLVACDGGGPSTDAGLDAGGADAGTDAGPPPSYYTLSGVDPSADPADLAPLEGILDGVDVVGIGESVHTTGGELEMRVRLIEYLVESLGYRAIALENPRLLTAQTIAPYVADCSGTAEDAARGFNPIWWDRTTPALLTWLCEFNRDHPSDPVTIHGLDIHEPYDTFREAQALLEAAAPSDAAGLLDGMRTCLGIGFADQVEYFMDPAVRSYYAGTLPLPDSDHMACLAGTSATLDYLSSNRDALVAASSAREVELARLSVSALAALDTTIYHLSRGDLGAANPSRDTAMADAFLTLRGLDFPDAKTILFAHNGHVMVASDEVSSGQWRGVENLGTQIEAALGTRYAAIGQASRTTYIDWDQGPQTLLHTDAAYLEEVLDQLGPPYLLVDTQLALMSSPPLWDATIAYRLGFDTMSPSLHYRAIVYHRESRANDYFTPPPFAM
ncbi:MAG: erythromycin esterase family protein [Sandaracinaceae bacterium]